MAASASAPYVEVQNLSVVGRQQDTDEVTILSDVSFAIARGEVLALIGESGSGKTTAGLSLMGYARPGCTITRGRVRLGEMDVLTLSPRELTDLRGRRVSYVAERGSCLQSGPAHHYAGDRAGADPRRNVAGGGANEGAHTLRDRKSVV